MLKLKNVSKFYYSKGVIAAGFSKVNIEFKLGEFVAIIGESGSGKSTLLNVISGLDSYEEGEMYINGSETSHYREVDFEEYRKKYVSNIFQNFNLVNSYTVYQNIELVLLLNGYKRKEVKPKVLELIDKVGLKKYKRTKVSKLSGGQRQRVAIARALAKDTPIIVCDEPTGNLDSRAAKGIIGLLKEISKDKLVIVVTHNFSEIADLATRVVKMHDGKIVSDKEIVKTSVKDDIVLNKNKNIGLFNMIRLGLRNTFNIIPKFVLIFIVFFFVTVSLLSVYGSLQKDEYEEGKLGSNYFFNDTSDTRIVIKKKDGKAITKDDFTKLKALANVSSVIENDIMLDTELWFQTIDDSYYNVYGNLRDIGTFEGELAYGRMPEADNEVIYVTDEYDYYFSEKLDDAIAKSYYFNGDKSSYNLKVVGVKYGDINLLSYNGEHLIYGSKKFLDNYMKDINREHSKVTVYTNGKNYESYNSPGSDFDLRVSNKVPKGSVYTPENINYICKDYDCKGEWLKVKVNNLYYNDELNLYIPNTYNEKNVVSILGINKDNQAYGSIFMNSEDYNQLFNKDSYQASVMAKHVDDVDSLCLQLEDLGYSTLQIRKTLDNMASEALKVLQILKLVVTIILIITLFFIAYFVIKLILKSRNIYYSTLRILGANFRHIKKILDIELFSDATLAYMSYIGLVLLVKYHYLNVKFVSNIIEYLTIRDYILMYVILVVMSYLISTRYASKIFKKSAMKSYREEV